MSNTHSVVSEQLSVYVGQSYECPNGPAKITDIYRDFHGKKRVLYTLNGHGDHGHCSLEFFVSVYGIKKRDSQ